MDWHRHWAIWGDAETTWNVTFVKPKFKSQTGAKTWITVHSWTTLQISASLSNMKVSYIKTGKNLKRKIICPTNSFISVGSSANSHLHRFQQTLRCCSCVLVLFEAMFKRLHPRVRAELVDLSWTITWQRILNVTWFIIFSLCLLHFPVAFHIEKCCSWAGRPCGAWGRCRAPWSPRVGGGTWHHDWGIRFPWVLLLPKVSNWPVPGGRGKQLT